MQMAGESAVWVGVLWHWASDVRLWILLVVELSKSPVVVEMAGESAIWMSVLWHWSSDVWLWVFLIVKLSKSPVVVEMAGESAIWMSILWHWASNVRLRILNSSKFMSGDESEKSSLCERIFH